jgi:hypothetical protein
MRLLLKLLPVLICGVLQAQNVTISGYVEDSETGEKLIGASIYDTKTMKGTTTNVYGFYSITLPTDSIHLRVSFVGFQTMEYQLAPKKDLTMNVTMNSSVELEEFEVVASEVEKIQEKSQMSTIDISMEKVKALPVFLGEKDVLKTIQLLPGVQSGSEGTSGLYVRGGGPDQNLMLLDGVPIYNASHLFGFFSVFNPDAINSVQLIKGGFPARYGGRLSSVLDIRMKEGNMKKFKGEGSVGLVASKLTLEGPIKKDTTSFIISARRTYIDLLARPFIAANTEGEVGGYYFYDLNAKINHKFSDKSRLYISNYMGDDRFYFRYNEKYTSNGVSYEDEENSWLRWGNHIAAVRWNYQLSNKLFSNTTFTYSKYRFTVGFREKNTRDNETDEYSFEYKSSIQDWAGKVDFDFLPNPNHYIKFGIGNIYHTFTPGVNQFIINENSSDDLDTTFGSNKFYSHEFSTYIEDDIRWNERLKTNVGLHFSGFNVKNQTYFSIQPRFTGRYLLNESSSIKASYAHMAQYMHLLSNTSIGLPTDLWVPVTDTIKPQFSHQVAIGYAHMFKDKYEISVEAYYKTMKNLIEYKDGASFFGSNTDWQQKVETGKGWSYGAEVLIERKVGKTTGWIGYTLSWTDRQFANINFGEKFPYRYDRRHDIGAALIHKFNDRVDIGVVWVYGTGNAVTLGLERYPTINSFENPNDNVYNTIEHIESRNNYRMPAYHRMDIGVNLHKKTKWGERTWNFSFYNAYNRQNPFYLFFDTEWQTNERKLMQLSLFPILPSFTYSFKF